MNSDIRSSSRKQHTMSDSGSNFTALSLSVQESSPDAFESASASESSEKSSASSYDRSGSRSRPRKRKTAGTLTSPQPRSKRLKSSYNDGYRGLFNSTVKEIASNQSETDNLLQETQIGVTVWSSEEKGAFFRALARRGRQDIRGIASDMGSKSESEVYLYSNMLYKAVVEQQIYETRKISLDTSKLEAALEIGGDCCAALDLSAEALSVLQQNEEEKAEKKRHKDLALLTPRIARWVESCVLATEGGKEEVSHLQQIPAAKLLNLKNFLALSKRFFMNSTIAENNWRSYTDLKTKSPSIMYTAFSDFHALIFSIAQRLVQSSLFFAMSRLRAMSRSGHYTPRPHVRRRDVIAALNVLGMETDAKAFWARAAQKCKLRVYDKVRHRQVFGKRYSYVEVERILSPNTTSGQDKPEKFVRDTSKSRKGRTFTESSASASEGLASSDSISIEADESSALSNDEDLSTTHLDPTNGQDHNQDGRDQLQDVYAEAIDQQASRNEECRLWELLGEDAAETMELEDVMLPKGPFLNRKKKEQLDDWRNWVDYAGDWETHETPVFGSSFASYGGFERDEVAGLTSSESISGSFINDQSTEGEHDFDSDEDADGDSASNIDGTRTLSVDDAERSAGTSGGDPDRDPRRSSLEDHSPSVREQRSGLHPGEDDARHDSVTRAADATYNDTESSSDGSINE